MGRAPLCKVYHVSPRAKLIAQRGLVDATDRRVLIVQPRPATAAALPLIGERRARPRDAMAHTQRVSVQLQEGTHPIPIEDGGLDGNLSTTGDNATFSRAFEVFVNAIANSFYFHVRSDQFQLLVPERGC